MSVLSLSPNRALSGNESNDTFSILEQPKLTGDWFGARDTISDHGLTFDINLTQFFQDVAAGGKEEDSEYGGKIDIYANFDSNKADLWPGFSLTTHVETRYGTDVNAIDGLFTLAGFNLGFPKAKLVGTGITAFKLTQSLGDHVLLIAGKINTLDDFRLNFTGYNGIDRFLNSAVVANIINARTVPYSTYGAGFAIFEKDGPELSFLARDPNDHPNRADLDQLFAHGVLLTGALRLPITPFGLPGTQVIGGGWSSRSYTALDPSAFVNIPGQGLVAGVEPGSWAIYYNFDQYLWINSSNKNQSLGIFGMSGISDGKANPVQWNITIGFGGSGLIPGREDDTCGVAYFHVGLSDDFKDLLSAPFAPPGLAQRDEQGVELYYNAALTPWCHLTPDLQIAQPSTKNRDTTVVVGTRLKIEF